MATQNSKRAFDLKFQVIETIFKILFGLKIYKQNLQKYAPI